MTDQGRRHEYGVPLHDNASVDPNTDAQFEPNSYFSTSSSAECAVLKAAYNPKALAWFFESSDFSITPAVATGCAADLTPVYARQSN